MPGSRRGSSRGGGAVRARARGGGSLVTPEALWRASDYNPNAKEYLKDASGRGHHMRLGSAGRADILGGALVLPGGTIGSKASTPDHVDLDITGDIDIRVLAALDNWTNTTVETFVAKRGTLAQDPTHLAYQMYRHSSGGLLGFVWYQGGGYKTAVSTAAPAVGNGQALWCRVTLDIDDGSGGHAVTFYTSVDGVAWIQLGNPVSTGAGVAALTSTSASLQVGRDYSNDSDANGVVGKIYRTIVKNGISGTTVFDADFSALKDGTPWFVEATGKRVTVQPVRSAVVGQALWLPGVAGQCAVTPDEVSLDITGDIDLRAKVALDDWTPASPQHLVAKWSDVNGGCSYRLYVNTSGTLQFQSSSSGNDAGSLTKASTVATGVADGATKWVRATLDVDNGVAGNDVKFWLSDDGSVWTQLGATVTTAGTTSIFNSPTPAVLGSNLTGSPLAGKVYRAIVKNGIDGTTVFDVDFSTWADGAGMGGYPQNDSTGKPVLVLSGTTGADTNDPKWLKYNSAPGIPESKGLYLPGVSGNYASVPDEAALDIVGDLTIDCEVSLDDWSPAAASVLASKSPAIGTTTDGYRLVLLTTSVLRLSWGDGTANHNVDSTVAVPAVDGQRQWVRATLDADNGAVGHDVKFFTSPDGTTWTQLGATVTTAVATAIGANATALEVGGVTGGTASLAAGRFFRTRVYGAYTASGANPGSLVLDVDFSASTEPHTSFACTTGQTVTINRSASGRKAAVVDRPMFLFGTDDYMECADHSALDFDATTSFSVAVAQRRVASGSTELLLAKRNVATGGLAEVGWLLRHTAGAVTFIADDGVTVHNLLVGGTLGSAMVLAAVLPVGGIAVTSFDGATATQSRTFGSVVNAYPVRIGRNSGTGGDYANMEFVGAGIWRRPLSSTEIAALAAFFGTDT